MGQLLGSSFLCWCFSSLISTVNFSLVFLLFLFFACLNSQLPFSLLLLGSQLNRYTLDLELFFL